MIRVERMTTVEIITRVERMTMMERITTKLIVAEGSLPRSTVVCGGGAQSSGLWWRWLMNDGLWVSLMKSKHSRGRYIPITDGHGLPTRSNRVGRLKKVPI
jgi:hypothetical protein